MLRVAVSALSVSVLASAAAAQGTLFPTHYGYPALSAPSGTALADVNGDGALDCFVANANTDKVSVYLGSSSGQLSPQAPVAVGGMPLALTLAHLNADPFLDLVTANGPQSTVSVLLGDGTGAFGSPTTFSAVNFPVSIRAGDVDGDGDVDIVTGEGYVGLAVLLGDGAGGLGAPLSTPLAQAPRRIELADMNLDGQLDCVVATWLANHVLVALGNGAGGFTVTASQFVPQPLALAVGDVTGDGYADVVTAGTQTDTVYLLQGAVNGGLYPPKTYWLQSTNVYPTSTMLADVSGDGRSDLVVASASSKTLTVFIGVGGSPYLEFAHISPMPESAYDAASGDLNGDGFADVVTSHQADGSIRAHLCAGVGSWEHYCTAKVNSLGCTPRVRAFGTPSVSNPRPFWVHAWDVLNDKQGMFLYRINGAHASQPFHGGTLCLGPGGIRRTPVKNSGFDPKVPPPNCTGTYAMDFNAFAQGLAGGSPDPALLVVGNSYQVQVWSRDPGFAPPNDVGLTSAIDVTPWH